MQKGACAIVGNIVQHVTVVFLEVVFRGRRGNSACPRFCKRTILFCTQVQSMGGGNPLTIHEIYAALTPSDSRSDWASEFAAAKQAEDYKI